jgi:hypothetical protein
MSVDTSPVMPGTHSATLTDMVTILRDQRASGRSVPKDIR